MSAARGEGGRCARTPARTPGRALRRAPVGHAARRAARRARRRRSRTATVAAFVGDEDRAADAAAAGRRSAAAGRRVLPARPAVRTWTSSGPVRRRAGACAPPASACSSRAGRVVGLDAVREAASRPRPGARRRRPPAARLGPGRRLLRSRARAGRRAGRGGRRSTTRSSTRRSPSSRTTGPSPACSRPAAALRWLRRRALSGAAARRSYNHPTDGAPTGRPQQSFPDARAGGARALARARRLPRVAAPPRGRASRGCSTRARRPPTAGPGSHHVLARVFKDIYPRFKTMRGYYVERKGGWDCHGLPVEIAVEQKLGIKIEGRDRGLRHRRVQRAVPRVGLRVPRGLERADRADRLLDRPRRRLPHARHRPTSSRSGGRCADLRQGPALRGPQGRPVLPALRHGAVLATRSRSATGTSSTRASTCASRSPRTAGRCRPATSCSCGRRRRGRSSPTPRSRSTPSSPTCAPRPGALERPVVLAEALVERVLGGNGDGGVQILARFPGAALDGVRYEPPFPYLPARGLRRARPHRPARRLRHRRRRHRPRAHRDRVRRGRLPPRRAVRPRTSSTRCASTAPTTSASAPYAGRFVKDADRRPGRGPPRAAAGCCAPRTTSTPTRTAGAAARRCSTTPSRRGTSRRRSMRDELLAANETVDWHPPHIKHGRFGDWLREQRRLGAVARALLGHAAAGLALRGPATSTCIGSFAELERAERRAPRGPAPAVRRRRRVPVPASAAATMRRVPEVIDVWFDSGCDAVRPVARAVRERGALRASASRPTSSARRSTRRAAGSTRCSRSRRCCSTARLPHVVCLGLHPRRRGPEDVASRRATSSCRGTSSTATAPTRSAGTSSPPSSRGTATASRSRRSARACACSSSSCGTPTASSTLYATRERDAPRPATTDLDRWIRSRLARRSPSVTERLEAFDATTAGRAIAGLRRRSLQLVRAPLAAALLGGRPAAFDDAARLPRDGRAAARAVHPVHRRRDLRQPRRHRAERAPCRLARARRRATRELEAAMAIARETVRLGLARARRRRRSRCASRCARPSSSPPAASARRSSGSPDVVRDELNVKALRFVAEADELGSYEVKPNYRTLGPRFGKAMPQVGGGGRGARPGARRRRAARRADRSASPSTATTTSSAPTTCMLAMQPLEGYQLEREGSHAVALDLAIDDELRREGLAREVVHAVQNARKAAGLEVEDRIALALGGDAELLDAARAHEDYVAGETLARRVELRRRRRAASARDDRGPRAADRRRAGLTAPRAALVGPAPVTWRRTDRCSRPRAALVTVDAGSASRSSVAHPTRGRRSGGCRAPPRSGSQPEVLAAGGHGARRPRSRRWRRDAPTSWRSTRSSR